MDTPCLHGVSIPLLYRCYAVTILYPETHNNLHDLEKEVANLAVLNNRVKQFPHQDIQTNSCIHFDIKHNISDYGHVAITCIMTGTNPENIGNIPATNKSIKA